MKRKMWREGDFWDSINNEFSGREESFQKEKLACDEIGKKYLNKVGVFNWLDALSNELKSSGTSWYNLAVLWKYISVHKPQYFLELGTGLSTHLISRAMEKYCRKEHDDNIKLISMEHSKEYYDHAIRTKPKCKFLEIILSEICFENVFMFLLAGYQDIPKLPYDMVFVDGPPQDTFVSGDLFWVIANSDKPVIGIIDQRFMSTMAYYLMLGSKYVKRVGKITNVIGPIDKQAFDYRELALDPWKKNDINCRIGYVTEDILGKPGDIIGEELENGN